MAVYKRDIADINLETGNIHRTFLNHSIGLKDQKADHFGVRVFRDGEPVNLTGVSVQGVFMPPQGSPIAITSGNIVSGNVAEVVLPQACYNYDGQFTLAIKLVDATNSVTGTMRIVDGMVDNTHASGTVAPTSAVPTYQEVLSVYEQAIAAINKTVRFDTTQSLTDTQKATARTNIGAASVGTANELAMDIGALAEGFANESYMDLGNKYMPFRRGYYSTPAVGSASSYQSNSQYFYALVMCQPGDILHAHCYGNSTVYAWAFLDSNLNVLSRGGTGNFEGTQTAPASTSYVLVNVDISHMSTGFYAWVGKESTGEKISDLKSAFAQTDDSFVDGTVALNVTWSRGSFDANGAESSSTTRIRTGSVYVGNIKSIHLVPATNYKIGFEMYAADGTYLGELSMGTDDRYISLGKTERNVAKEIATIRFLGAKSSNGTIYASDGSNFTMYGISKSVNRIADGFEYSDNIASALWDRLAVPVDPDLFEIGKYQRNSSSSAGFTITNASICNRMLHPIKLKIDDQVSLTDYTNYSLTVVRKIGSTYYTNTITSGFFINDADCDAAITLTHASSASLDAVSLIRIIRPRQKANVYNEINSWQVGYGIIGGGGYLKVDSAAAVSNFFCLRKGDLVSLPVSSGFDCYIHLYSLSDFTKIGHISINSSNGYRIIGGDYDLYYACIQMNKHSGDAVTENEIKTVAADWLFTKENANIQPERKVIGVGHMGYYYAPQNSVIGVQMAAKAGWKAVEVDVHFTSDNVAVGIHNQSINDAARNDDGTEISGTVNINEITYEQALAYDFGIVKGSQFAHTQISKIDDIFKTAHQLGLLVMLDIKDTPVMTRTQIEKLVDIVNDNGMIGNTIFMVGQVMKYGQWIIRKDKSASITGYGSQSNWADSYAYISGHNTVYYDSLYSTIVEEYTAACVAAGFPQGAYTVNNATNMDALPNCISLYTSDYLNAENYFANKNNQSIRLTTPGVRSSRAISVVGGYIRNGDTVRVDMQFTGNADHTITPGVFTDMPVPENGNAVLRCIKYTGTLSEPTLVAEIPCMVNDSVILLKELENGGKYVITGEYSI